MKIKFSTNKVSVEYVRGLYNWLSKQNDDNIVLTAEDVNNTIWFYMEASEEVIVAFILKFSGHNTEIRHES